MPKNIEVDFSKAIANNYSGANKIEAIKSIRSITGCGLKEAKDMSEQSGKHTLVLTAAYNFGSTLNDEEFYENHFRILRNNNVSVGESVHLLLKELRLLGAKALEQGEDELASEILQMVMAEKLRRSNVYQ